MHRFPKGSNDSVAPNFRAKEFDCHCGREDCRGTYIHPTLVCKLNALRKAVAMPLRINSGYRCAAHNHAIGGTATSWHVAGCAVDVACPAGMSFTFFLSFAHAIGFKQIIPYEDKHFVHLTQY
jgi:uncharacterized protein YcbK (DUF882 family)